MNYTKNKGILKPHEILFIALGVFSAAIWRLSVKNSGTADFFTGTVSFFLRFILTKATYLLPFSLAEFLLFAALPLAVYLIIRFILKILREKHGAKARLLVFAGGMVKLFAFAGCLMFVFVFTFGVCYGKTTVNEKMGFERRLLDSGDLYSAMEILISEISAAEEKITGISETGSTIMPYDLKELNNKLNAAYKNMLGEYGLFRHIYSNVKPVILSEQMSKMHITGIYFPFTGEANVNVNFPDYNLPFTAAHEMAHLMGVAREDEANFTAFLVCLHSSDDYIRYSGLVNMSEYIGNALYRANSEKYREIMGGMPKLVINEMAAYSKFFDKYRDSDVSKIASAANDAYLRAQGQEQGVKSYGLAVDLSVVYLLDIYNAKIAR